MGRVQRDQDVLVKQGNVLMQLARRLTSNEQDALDLVQDTFEQGLRRLSPDLPPSKIQGWLQVTLRNRCLDLNRRQLRLQRLLTYGLAIAELASEPRSELPPWSRVEPEVLWSCVQRLSHNFRTVFLLRNRDHLAYGEIARRLDMPVSTVGTRHHRAIRQLREMLEPLLRR